MATHRDIFWFYHYVFEHIFGATIDIIGFIKGIFLDKLFIKIIWW